MARVNRKKSAHDKIQAHITLYRKYRPKLFADIVGQPHVVEILRTQLKSNTLSHAYLFVGPRGTGKTSTARILAKAVNCENPGVTGDPCNQCDNCKAIDNGSFVDLFEIDAASNRGIDNIRELQEKLAFSPSRGKKKVYIIDEVHMLTKEAFNALLKTLEEPPEHVLFILATTEPHKVPETIMSRCERLDFHLADKETLLAYIKQIVQQENLKIDDAALELLVEQSQGSFRDLLSLLESILASAREKKIDEAKVREILRLPTLQQLKQVVEAMFAKDPVKVSVLLEEFERQGTNMAVFVNELIKYIRSKTVEEWFNDPVRWRYGVKLLATLFKAYENIRLVFDSRLLLETLLWEYIQWLDSQSTQETLGAVSKAPLKKTDEEVSPQNNSDFKEQDQTVKSEYPLNKEEIVKKWPQFLEEFKKANHNNIVYPVLLKSEVASVTDTPGGIVVTIRVPDYSLFRKKLLSNKVQNMVNSVFSSVLGRSITVKFLFDKSLNGEDQKIKTQQKDSSSLEESLAEVFGDNIEIEEE